MASMVENALNEQSAMVGLSSDESFTAPTSVEGADMVLSGGNNAATLIANPEGIEARLKADAALVRDKFRDNLVEEAREYDSAEERHASLLEIGWANAVNWLANKAVLRPLLVGIGLTPAKDDVGLLGQIAKLQLGDWKPSKDGSQAWSVPNRRDERLGRFYRIFFADQDAWKVGQIADAVLKHKGKSGGVLSAAKPNVAKPDKKEVADNRERASRAEPKVSVNTNLRVAKQGDYRLVLVRSTSSGFDVCHVVDDEALTERLTNKWAAEAALTVPPKAA